MRKKAFHIAIIALLALNLMGSWGLAAADDCEMTCCAPSETGRAGIPTFEAPSCCSETEVSCNFEASQSGEFFDTALICFGSSGSAPVARIASGGLSLLPEGGLSGTHFHPGDSLPPLTEPLFLKNLSLIC